MKFSPSTFHVFKTMKFSLNNNFNNNNTSNIRKDTLFNSQLHSFKNNNNYQDNIIKYTKDSKKNLFLNSIRITKLKDKIVSTNYEFFEYHYRNHFSIYDSQEDIYQENLFKEINNNFLLTSFFCIESHKTKTLIEFIKTSSEFELNNYNHKEQDYKYQNNFDLNNKLIIQNKNENLYLHDSLNLNLIFDISLIDQKKRNFSKCLLVDDFLIYVSKDETIFFSLSDIMQVNVNLIAFSFRFSEFFNSEKNLAYINKNIRNIPQTYNWPIICGLKPQLVIAKNNDSKKSIKDYSIEKSFVFLYYNCKKNYKHYINKIYFFSKNKKK